MNSGYVMIDFSGASSGTNPALATKISEAVATGKLIIGYGLNSSPVALVANSMGDELVGNGVTISIDGNDITINELTPNTVTIISQPSNATAVVGASAKFTVEAVGEGELSYQWYSRTSSSAQWTKSNFSGNKTAELTVATNLTRNGYQYACVITDGFSSVMSNPATLTVTES